jgi:uncharacterized lipoprotein YmbA
MKYLPLIVALMVAGCGSAQVSETPETTTEAQPTETAEEPASAITKENYDAIAVDTDLMDGATDGSTLAEVQTLLGSEGEVLTSSEFNGVVIEGRNWQEGFTVISVTFTDGVATGKSQTGL